MGAHKDTGFESSPPADDPATQIQQRLRLRRMGMAAGTYVVVITAAFLTTVMGFGHLSRLQWFLIIALAVLINGCFFAVIYTGANLRFADPSLTWAQIFISALWGALPIYEFAEMRPILLMFYIPAFSFGMLRLNRRQYLALVACVMFTFAAVLLLQYIRFPETFRVKYELSVFAIFGIVLTWFAFFGGFVSSLKRRLKNQHAALERINKEMQLEMEERIRVQDEKDWLIMELKDAMSNVKTLGGLLPICASCKKIRDDKGYWNQIESYLRKHSELEFSHGVCPDCAKKIYADIAKYNKDA